VRAPFTISFVLLITALYTISVAYADPIPRKWWKSPPVKKELGLTPEQERRIDDIFKSYVKRMRETSMELRRQQKELHETAVDPNCSSEKIRNVSLQVENTRSSLRKLRLEMLLEIRDVLTPQQRMKLRQIRARHARHGLKGGK